ncbi:MAG: hypothetical protein IJZ75_05915 [Clostridia bacterium]|nr:hypothetical protein [Clostridia bacterium]
MLVNLLSFIETDEDKTYFTDLYNKHKDMMFSIADNILSDDSLSEDAVNDAFLKIIEHFETVKNINEDKVIGSTIIQIAFFMFMVFLYSKILIKPSLEILHTIGYIIAVLLPLLLSSYQFYGLIRCLIAISKGKYKIVTDKVVGKDENFPLFDFQEITFHCPTNLSICVLRRQFAFHFSSYDRYLFGSGRQGKHILLSTPAAALFNCTNEGDEFYLAVIEDKLILNVYSVKRYRFEERYLGA